MIGIEIPNTKREIVGFREAFEQYDGGDMALPVMLGRDINGKVSYVDLVKMPHLLVAGQTGSGKSAFLHSVFMGMSLLNHSIKGRGMEVILIDPKRVEFAPYRNNPCVEVVSDMTKVPALFKELVTRMEERYEVLQDNGCRNIQSFLEQDLGYDQDDMLYTVVIVDELADLIMTHGKEVEPQIVRLAQLSRAVGIHMILATQKPIVKVLTGLIKANIPARVAFRTASNVDSRVILDASGAENLTGRGDMLYLGADQQEAVRYHGAWVSDKDIQYYSAWWKSFSEKDAAGYYD